MTAEFERLSPEEFLGPVPIHKIPKGRDVIRPSVLIIQVVSMLPDVQTNEGVPTSSDTPSIRGESWLGVEVTERLPSLLLDQPSPPGSEPREGGLAERFLHGVKASERLMRWRPPSSLAEDRLPEGKRTSRKKVWLECPPPLLRTA